MRRISERNIFPSFDLYKEYEKIEELFSLNESINIPTIRGKQWFSIQFVVSEYFLAWKLRGTFTSINEMRDELGINTFSMQKGRLTEETVLHFLQFAINCVNRARNIVQENNHWKFQNGYVDAIVKNINELASKLGTDIVFDRDINEYYLQYKEDTVAAIAKQNPDISESLYEYLRIDNRSNLKRKREILSTLFRYLESIEGELKGTEFKTLVSDTKAMMNAARHNENDKTAFAKEFANRNDEEKENWCDKSYSLFIACMATLPYIDEKVAIAAIRSSKS